MLEFNIRNQEISRIDNFSPAEKSVGYLVAKFNFKTDDWNGASKIAVFKNLKTKEEYDRKLEEDACIVPSEALSEKGQFEVSVYGLKDGQKITSNVATCNLNRTLSGGSMTEDDSLNAAEKLLLEAQNKLDKSGHAPNKFLGTDEKGNVVTKEQEEFSLEVAGEEKLGGVKPLNKTDDMTLEVGVDKDGRLFAKGKDITVDSKLSEKSENPVQNKVLTKEVITLKEHNTQLKETIEKLQIKQTTDKAPFHHITDSANMKVLDFGMEGKTTQDGTPTPENQVEIVNAGVYNEATGRYEIGCRVCTGNLFDVDSFAKTCEQTVNDDGTISISANSAKYFFDLPDIPTVFRWEFVTTTNTGVAELKFVFKDGTFAYLSNSNTSVKLTKQLDYVTVLCYAPITVKNLKLEYGDIASTDYIPHASQQFTLTSPVPLTMWDKLVKRDGVWGWSIWQLINTFNGNEDWYINNNNIEGYPVFRYDEIAKALISENEYSMCSHFRHKPGAWSAGIPGEFGDNRKVNDSIYFVTSVVKKGDVAGWKAWLQSNNITVVTKASTEQAFHPLPDEEQELLNNLETYYGVTNLYNDQGCPTWLTYIADPKLYLDNQLLEIKSAIV